MVESVPEVINFPEEEEKVLDYWKKTDAFQKSLQQSKKRPRFSFYDGPPFATGLPHYGHILAGSIKDVVTRYAHQNGYHVERRFGWDCHGLPVEYEIDKTLGIKGPEDVMKMGIENYNNECRKIVMRYSGEWENVVTRMGRWIDFKNDYKTMYPSFMETVWWIFHELWWKGFVYRGVKVMPFSTGCNTPLSNFESGQNYKEVVDPAVVVSFPLTSDPNVSMIAWTTTPWTLPSNLALCVNPALNYIKIKEKSSGRMYILMEARMEATFKNADEYEILETFPGEKLKGLTYKPLFSYFATHKNAFKVLTDSYVTEESGTGIVHQAPYFGEDDNRVCLAAGVITKDQAPVCPIDDTGKFTSPVTEFLGQYVKDADKNIIKYLKQNKRLVSEGSVKHSYPFCWRSETPLIYRAVPSWFIRVQHMTDLLIEANQSTYWVPDFVKEKRFGNWLRDARDWAVSRNRFWGTPIPVWASEDLDEFVCVSSIDELEKLTGTRVTDLHRETVDKLTIPSKTPGKPPLRRIPEVFDCWFESGCMPYAQVHFPFENKSNFPKVFPADFIAEGIDQTRGWFYTLLVISVALFGKAPFKNLIVNGLVLASDGQKMSKRKKNYPDPMEIVSKFGADALRLYLVNSPVVRAENLRFKEEGVRDILKDVFLPWYNAYRFFIQNVERLNVDEGLTFSFNDETFIPKNLMDQWILSFTQSLQAFIRKEMEAYRLYTVVPCLVNFIDNLTNWYVRMNRKRLKGESGIHDCKDALCTLGSILSSMTRMMAPYTPFLTELMFKNLRVLTNRTEESIHHVLMPPVRPELINTKIEEAVERMQTVIDLGRIIRDRKTIPVKYPLKEVVVILDKEDYVKELKPFEKYIMEELNVKDVKLTTDKNSFGVTLRAEPDHKTLGARLKGQFKAVMQAIKDLKDSDVQKLQREGQIEVLGETIKQEDIRIMFSFSGPAAKELSARYETHALNDVLVLLDIIPDESMQAEGTAREIINRVQKLRKKAHLVPTDKINVYYEIKPEDSSLAKVAADYKDFIEGTLKAPFILGLESKTRTIAQESISLKGATLSVLIASGEAEAPPSFSRYVNVALTFPPGRATSDCATILLENPVGQNILDLSSLKREIQIVFGIQEISINLVTEDGRPFTEENLKTLNGGVVYAVPKRLENPKVTPKTTSTVKYINVVCGDQKGTLLLENPVGRLFNLSEDDLRARTASLFNRDINTVSLKKDDSLITVT